MIDLVHKSMNEAGALVSPKGITRNSFCPYLYEKWSSEYPTLLQIDDDNQIKRQFWKRL